MNQGTLVQHSIGEAQATLDGQPTTAAEWQTIARHLRRAADAAREVAKLAKAMNGGRIS